MVARVNGTTTLDESTVVYLLAVLTTHRLAYQCCQCDASLDVKLARLVVARSER